MSVKYDANIFIGDRYMAILLLCRFGCEMAIPAHFGEVSCGFDPLNVVAYCRDPPKRTSLAEKKCVLAYRSCQLVKKCDLGACWRKQKNEKRKRCDKSHICSDHPRCATPTKVVMWGGVPDVVNHAKFHQNRFRVLAPRGVKISDFPMLSAMAYITG